MYTNLLKKSLHEVLSITPKDAIFDVVLGEDSGENSAYLVLAAMPLVDVSSAEWKQILEFRKDKASRRKLLRFREFFYDNIKIHNLREAQERLEMLKLDYDDAAKKHGFEMTYQSLSSVMSMRAVSGGGILGLLSAQAGLGPLSLAAAAIPTVAELGMFCLHLYGKKHAVAEFQAANPISYLSVVEEKLLSR